MKPKRSFLPNLSTLEDRHLLSTLSLMQRPLARPTPLVRQAAPRLPATAIATSENPSLASEIWLGWHDEIRERARETGPVPVAFFGDSITGHWVSTGREAWETYFEPLGAVDQGIAGSTTQNLLWHLKNGGLAGTPRVAVVQIGINNVGLGDSPEDTAQGILAVVRGIRAQSPRTRVVLLSLFPPNAPEGTPGAPGVAAVAQTNRLIAPYQAIPGVRVVDLGHLLLGADGLPRPEFYEDAVHLSPDGYAALAPSLFGTVEQTLMGSTPHRPERPGVERPAPPQRLPSRPVRPVPELPRTPRLSAPTWPARNPPPFRNR